MAGAGLAVPGFRMLTEPEHDELGAWYEAEEDGTGRRVTVRVVTVAMDAGHAADLEQLWSELAESLPPDVGTLLGHGRTAEGALWVSTDGPPGEPLGDRLLDVDELRGATRDLIGGLAALHDADLVHGRITPAAIVLRGGRWELRDIGIGRIVLATPEAPHVATPETDLDDLIDALERASRRSARPNRARHEMYWSARPSELRRLRSRAKSAQGDSFEDLRDEDVQFTVYRPRVVRPGQWYDLLAFAHKTDPGQDESGPTDPLEEVRRQAEQVLGGQVDDYRSIAAESSIALEWGSDLQFVPDVDGVDFNPPSCSFRWLESVHREEFRFRAAARLNGQTARGRVSVFLGTLLIAEVTLAFKVDDTHPATAATRPDESSSARPYRRIFVSYSHRDIAVVEQVSGYAKLFGDEYIRDWTHLRAGEVWSDRLAELIRTADVFQLFWSTNSMASSFVQQEWRYALSLNRASFVRPVYWEEPLPERSDLGLPPEALRRLQFQRLAARVPDPEREVPDVTRTVEAEGAGHYYDDGYGGVTAESARQVEVPARLPAPEAPAARRRKRPPLLVGVGVAFAAVVALLVFEGLQTTTEPGPPPATITTTATRTTATTTATTTLEMLRIVDARTDTDKICVAGRSSDTTGVSVSVDPVRLVVSVSVMTNQGGRQSTVQLGRRGTGATYTATLGPFDRPGAVTWVAEVRAQDGTVRQSRGVFDVVLC